MAMAAEIGAAQTATSTYPTKSVRWVVPFPAGGSNDIVARIIGQKLGESLGQPFLADNRSGAGGMVGAETVAKANPDGYTLLLANAGPSLNNVLMRRNPPYKVSDFAQVVWFGYAPLIIVTSSSSPLKTARDLVAVARENPGKLTWGVFGLGGVPHLQFYSLLLDAKADMVAVPYKSIATMMADATGGQLDIGVTAFGSFGVGTVRVLASLAGQRNELYPDVPAAPELGYRVSDSAYGGFLAPKGTPTEALTALEGACAKAAETARWKDVLKRTGSPGPYLGAAAYAKRLREDSRVKGELVRILGIKAE